MKLLPPAPTSSLRKQNPAGSGLRGFFLPSPPCYRANMRDLFDSLEPPSIEDLRLVDGDPNPWREQVGIKGRALDILEFMELRGDISEEKGQEIWEAYLRYWYDLPGHGVPQAAN